ncbi:MAG: cupin domain-containing protein [Acidimicrobiia bacterium]|nr:cupin domain-containing protein [Acidimicrobiia bacterium]
MTERPPVPPGMRYDERRQWLLPQGIVARNLAEHPLFPRPKRNSRAAAFDELAGNTTLGIHLSQMAPGGTKPGHRHVDEAALYVIYGYGYSEMRQSDDAPMQRVDWKAGDIISIPSNAWHQHFNADPDNPTLQLAFKNTRWLRTLFGSRDFVYENDFRFVDRYDDEADYWTRHKMMENGIIDANVLHDLAREPLAPAPDHGEMCHMNRYQMGGHYMLDFSIVEMERRGRTRAHKPMAEEALYGLSGRFRTWIWDEDGNEDLIEWGEGDLLSPPLGVWRRHTTRGHDPARFLHVRNNFFNIAMGNKTDNVHTPIPNRYPDMIEPDYSGYVDPS